ncbi:hypothetical protein [Clostridium sp.]|uniref:hypothetical protein n=1 Tax=Clostridium sp. TaxID=1506 RepID=UPI001A4B0DF5|nr:hypothetical protein [Clostridium sp.]MBK5240238.1 hypothetical protein [Clostridium sp.]
MNIVTTNLEKKVKDALKLKMGKSSRSLSSNINQLVGVALGVKTNEEIVIELKKKFEVFVSQSNNRIKPILDIYYSNEGNCELHSGYIERLGKQGRFRISLTDNLAVVQFRYESKDEGLRNNIINLLNKKNTNKWIKLDTGAKYSSLGLNTRTQDDIISMNAQLMFDVWVDLYNLIF